jgi:chemotaxis signal transduction protein
VSGQDFAFNIFQVERILRYEAPAPLPKAPDFLEGVLRYQGVAVPLVDLRKRLGAAAPLREETRTVILEWEGGKLGVIVDAVTEVLQVAAPEITSPPGIVKGLAAEYITGLVVKDGRTIIVLNTAKLLASKEKLARRVFLDLTGLPPSPAELDQFLAPLTDAGVDVRADGTVRIRFGGADPGTGQKTALAQVAAEELGVDLSRITVVTMDSEETPFDLGSWSSRGTVMGVHAVGTVARSAARRLRELAADKLGVPAESVLLRDGHAVAGDARVPIEDLVTTLGKNRQQIENRF